MKFVTFTKNDIPRINAFDAMHAPPPQLYYCDTSDELQALFADKTFVYYGVFLNNTMIAQTSYLQQANDVYFLGSLIIHSKYRNQGLGSKIFSKVKEDIIRKGGKKIVLTVSPLNDRAVVFYSKNGFIITETKKDVYGPGTDRHFMELTL